MTQNKITALPPKLPSQDSIREQFISGAESTNKTYMSNQNHALPWKEASVRNDIKISYTLQLPEPYLLKLRYISARTNKSQQNILRELVMPGLDKFIDELIKEDG